MWKNVFDSENENWFCRHDFNFENRPLIIVKVLCFSNYKIQSFKDFLKIMYFKNIIEYVFNIISIYCLLRGLDMGEIDVMETMG